MHGVVSWFRTPLPLKFWLLAAAAAFVVSLEISAVWQIVEAWSAFYPLHSLKAQLAAVYIAGLFVLGAVLIWRAIRAYPRHS